MEYGHIIVSKDTKLRFLNGHVKQKEDTQESGMVELLDFFDKYHAHEAEIEKALHVSELIG